MNLKHYFYRKYYEGIDLRKFKSKDAKDVIENANVSQFEKHNDKILKYKPINTFSPFALTDYLENNKHFKKIPLATQYPGLFIGSGYPHQTNNKEEIILGFHFDHTTGLPVIPGSSVKGTLRSVFPQFKSSPENILIPNLNEKKEIKELKGNKANYIAYLLKGIVGEIPESETNTFVHQLELQIFTGLNLKETHKAVQEKKLPVYFPLARRDCFLDAIPVAAGNNGKLMGIDSITPHTEGPLRNPTPLPFIKVLPNVTFSFQFLLFPSLINILYLAIEQKKELFTKILLDIGIGAKTNVGYGKLTEGKLLTKLEVGMIVSGTVDSISSRGDVEVSSESFSKHRTVLAKDCEENNLKPGDNVSLKILKVKDNEPFANRGLKILKM